MNNFENKKILLIICGGIAAYKSLEIIRLLKKKGALVKTILTKNANKFVTPLSVTSLSQEKVYSDLFDHKNENYVGSYGTSVSPKLIANTKSSDLIVVLGARLGEMTTQGYSIIDPQDDSKNMIHIHVDPNELNKVYNANVCINVGVEECCDKLEDLNLDVSKRWLGWRNELKR